MNFYIESPAVLAPGLPDWASAKKILNGQLAYQAEAAINPGPVIIPDTIYRRCSASTMLAIHVAEQTLHAAQHAADELSSVFVSAVGDPEIDNKLCLSVVEEEPMPSPILFHNSVHNAPAGYWSISTGSQAHTTSLAAGEHSFSTGLLSAYAQLMSEKQAILLVAYDQPLQGDMGRYHRLADTFACSLLLTPKKTANSLLACELSLTEHENTIPQVSPLAELDELYQTVPAARALPLLALLAKPQDATLSMNNNNDLDILLTCRGV